MLIAVLGITVTTSCTSDEFFRIEEDYEGVSFSMLEKIALSKEYVEFQKQSFLLCDIVSQSIDTTKINTNKNNILEYGTHNTKETNCKIVSIESFLIAKQRLLDSYPEYGNTNTEERNQIFNLAIMNCRSLRKMASSYSICTNCTKSSSPESDAVRYAQSVEGAIRLNTRTWRIANTAVWITDDSFTEIISMAVSRAEDGKEHGGYIFNDYSGILNEDQNAAPDSMTFYWNKDAPKSMQPWADFHIHPNNSLVPSEYDLKMYLEFTWNNHFIMDREGNIPQL